MMEGDHIAGGSTGAEAEPDGASRGICQDSPIQTNAGGSAAYDSNQENRVKGVGECKTNATESNQMTDPPSKVTIPAGPSTSSAVVPSEKRSDEDVVRIKSCQDVRPKTKKRDETNEGLSSAAEAVVGSLESRKDNTTEREYSKADVEQLFTTLYCYTNLLEAISEDNDSDHFRFIQFIKQVEHKQSELVRVSDALPDCANLALDVAYNFVVASSYMNLMFTWESGKELLRDELAELALGSARHMLNYAHTTHEQLQLNCIEEMIETMQKFCLVNVVEQANKMPHLSPLQKKVLNKLEEVIARYENKGDDSISSVHTDEFDFIYDEDEETNQVDGAVKEATDFGKVAYDLAVKLSKQSLTEPVFLNTNNNADNGDEGNDTDVCSTPVTPGPSEPSFSPENEPKMKAKLTDMDDIILFSNCNPFSNIWKLYTDNQDLVSNFKITKTLRNECVENIPECFKVLLCVENLAYNACSQCLMNEIVEVNENYRLLQQLVGMAENDGDYSSAKEIVNEIATDYSDIDVKLNDVFQLCESEISGILDQLHNAGDDDSENGENGEDTSSESEES